MRYLSTTPFCTRMVFAAVLLLNIAEATVVGAPSSHACQERIDTELNDGPLSKRACYPSQPQGQRERRSDSIVDISSSVSAGGSSIRSVSIGDESGNEPPRGGAGGTEAMAVVKAASMTSEGMSHGGVGGGIYYGGHSKAHMGSSSSVSSSAGERVLRQCAAGSGGAIVGAAVWTAAALL